MLGLSCSRGHILSQAGGGHQRKRTGWISLNGMRCLIFPAPLREGPGKPTPVLRLSSSHPEGPSAQLLAEAGELQVLPPHPLASAHQTGPSQTGIFLTPSCYTPLCMLFSPSAMALGVCASVGPSSRPLWLPLPESSPSHTEHLHQPCLAFPALLLAAEPHPKAGS